ncbi:MAG: nucleotide exchange factor GrpE [Gammaproteobacteria bacterium]|nr:nucleotide exchange factor GrpE [Gammaproteobacteria bacterium]
MSDDSTSSAAENETADAAGDTATVEQLQAALAESRDQSEKLKDQALRAQAEVENIRRRATRDVEAAHKFALERFTADLLPVVDSLERAVEAAQAADAAGNVAAIAEGVELSRKLFVDTLEKSGVAVVDPIGAPFDPQFHQAMSMVESADAEPGSVLNVLQRGYTLNGRLVRPAMVMVAKAAAKPVDEQV